MKKAEFVGSFGDQAVEALEKADHYANKDGVIPGTRAQLVEHHTQRALVLSILAVAEEISIQTRHA